MEIMRLEIVFGLIRRLRDGIEGIVCVLLLKGIHELYVNGH
jgi:hypothetical protein